MNGSIAPRSGANADLLARSRRAVWHPATQLQTLDPALPIPIARGEGPWLFDMEGRRYLDAISSWWVNLFGHRDPHIVAAIRAQLDRLEHVLLAGCTHAPVVELSERLSAATGGALGHAFYASDGASATEIAMKMSAHFWRNGGQPGKHRFVALAGGYHGETAGALGVTDVPMFRAAYEALVHAATVLPSPDARGAQPGETAETVAIRAAAALAAHLEAHADETAALIVEPLVQCAGGMAMHHRRYLQLARELCTAHDVHLICDEIAVGFGRTGTLFAHEQAGIRPDFLCLSKGLTGGFLPLSVVLATDAIHAAFLDDSAARGFLHSHSYTGNPLACAAALAVLDRFDRDAVLATNAAKAARFDALAAPLAADPRIAHWRRTGMIWAFDVPVAPRGFGRTFSAAARDAGVLLVPLGRTVYFMPPYVIDDAEFTLMVVAARHALDRCFTGS